MVDLDPPASIATYHPAGTFYQEAPAVTGELVVPEPFPMRIDIPALVARR
ncbi:MAG TPA: hypothetical protein VGX25_13240 [Actinophytocola sp.]|nr:hypothetical protein [Actinophytocola sp.]HEV2780349.1 hypothetical protein [Actinophytocola sp.]